MGRRAAARAASPDTRGVQALVLALVVAMVTGPGVAASSSLARGQTQPMLATAQTDPVADLALDLEYDADMIFRFVADEIRYEPYTGILRGAQGTLAARAGNSVDKALLLAALLDASLIQYRFARGPMDEASATRITESMATDLGGAREAAADPFVRGGEAIAATAPAAPTSGPLAALYEQQARAIEADGRTRLELARSRLGDTMTMLSDALVEAGVRLPADTDVPLPGAETADHTWVEMRSGASWVNLDPTLAAAQPGVALTTASETLDRLPDDLRYGVAFDVLVERVEGGQLVTRSVLRYDDFADQLAGAPVTFSHITPSGIKRLGIALDSLLGGGWIDYRPILDFGIDRSWPTDRSPSRPSEAARTSSRSMRRPPQGRSRVRRRRSGSRSG